MRNLLRQLLFLFVAVAPASLGAQVVRGTVTERLSGEPLPGVIVALRDAVGPFTDESNAVLTNQRGGFAIHAPGPGRYQLTAKRIGVRRYISATFTLDSSETRSMEVVLEALPYTISPVTVEARALCAPKSEQSEIAGLWDEARSALLAVQISGRDSLFSSKVYRYSRTLAPETLELLTENRVEWEGLIEQTFRTQDAASLSSRGYWRPRRDTVVYHVPDARALLSEQFERDHCFHLVRNDSTRPNMVGLGFDVTPERRVPDVSGTIWLDAATMELRIIAFRYTRLPAQAEAPAQFGGEVRFTRVPNGSWIIRQWFIRMPQLAVTSTRLRNGARRREVTIPRVFEDGGNAFGDGLAFFEPVARVSGVSVDSAGVPTPGVAVRLLGTPHQAITDSAGRFRFDSGLPTGHYTVEVRHPDYDSLGVPAAREAVDLREGEKRELRLQWARDDAIAAALCRVSLNAATLRATIFASVRDSVTDEPVRNTPVWLYQVDEVLENETLLSNADSFTNDAGAVVFCQVPREVPLVIRIPAENAEGMVALPFRIESGSLWRPTLVVKAKR